MTRGFILLSSQCMFFLVWKSEHWKRKTNKEKKNTNTTRLLLLLKEAEINFSLCILETLAQNFPCKEFFFKTFPLFNNFNLFENSPKLNPIKRIHANTQLSKHDPLHANSTDKSLATILQTTINKNGPKLWNLNPTSVIQGVPKGTDTFHSFIYTLIRYWMALWFCLWFCSFGIETTFPSSNFKTKHIFGILMKRVKYLKPFEAPAALQICFLFSYHRRRRRIPPPRLEHSGAPNLIFYPIFFYRRRSPKGAPEASQMRRRRRRSPGGPGKSCRRLVFRE